MFLIEAAPSIILAFFVWRYLTDRPASAEWLPADERAWLTSRLDRERVALESGRGTTVWQALLNPAVLAMSVIYFGVGANSYGLAFFLPQIVKAFGLTNLQTGFVAAIPFLVGTIGMVWWARRWDRHGERRLHTSIAFGVAGVAMIVAALSTNR